MLPRHYLDIDRLKQFHRQLDLYAPYNGIYTIIPAYFTRTPEWYDLLVSIMILTMTIPALITFLWDVATVYRVLRWGWELSFFFTRDVLVGYDGQRLSGLVDMVYNVLLWDVSIAVIEFFLLQFLATY